MGLYSNFAKAPVHSVAWGGDGNVAMILPLSTDRKGLKAVDTEQGKDWTLGFVATRRGHNWFTNVATERGRKCSNSSRNVTSSVGLGKPW